MTMNDALPNALYTPEQVRALDQAAIHDYGIPGRVLMSRAGRCAWRLLHSRYPGARRILVLCGGGNNGGDGFVIARLAAEAGLHVDLCVLSDWQTLEGDAGLAARQACEVLAPTQFWPERAAQADVVVDALLGTGLDRPVTGAFAEAIDAVNAVGKPVLAVDVPSGLSAATGKVLGTAIQAAVTPTFIGLKRGLFTGDAAGYVGEVVFDDLGVPAGVYDRIDPAVRRFTMASLKDALPARPRQAHKGAFGHALVIGGDRGLGGAVRIAGEASARSGAGLVSVATRSEHVPSCLAARPELMVHGLDQPELITPLLDKASVVAIGPGLGQDEAWGRRLFGAALAAGRPLVVDADALNLLAVTPVARPDWVLTPHPGEAARLLGCQTDAVEADRFAAVAALAKRYGGVVVLKGAGTIVGDQVRCHVIDAGNPGMASGGMGDALTGIILGLRAQGLSAWEAASVGARAHAEAGDRAARQGERGLLVSDLVDQLRGVVNP